MKNIGILKNLGINRWNNKVKMNLTQENNLLINKNNVIFKNFNENKKELASKLIEKKWEIVKQIENTKNLNLTPHQLVSTLTNCNKFFTIGYKGAVGSGIKLEIRGRLNSSGIASKKIFSLGKVPRQSFNTPIRQLDSAVRTKVGLLGIRILTN